MVIRKLEIRDLAPMIEWMRDADVTKYLQADFASITENAAQEFIIDASNQNSDSKCWHFAITDENNSYIGTISLKNIDKTNRNAEYAIVTSKNAHGKGYAYKASKELLDIAFNELNLERVYLCVTTDNTPANKLYQKLGFKEEGIWKKHLCIKGIYHDLRWYGLLKENYQ